MTFTCIIVIVINDEDTGDTGNASSSKSYPDGNNMQALSLHCKNFYITEPRIITLEKVLAFFTGAEYLPPLGYENVTLQFSSSNPFPTASTCAIELTLPIQYGQCYQRFKQSMNTALLCYGGFGLS